VARAAAVPPAPDTMSPNQLARRLRVLEAVIGLVADGGIEEMQMRELAERSGVALGTVYRYFSSKDHVVAAALVEWARQLDQNVSRRPLPSGTMADRLKALLRQGVRPFRREPNFAALMVRAASSTDPFASQCYQELGPIVTGTLGRALPELEADEREQVLRLVGAVWFTGLNEWVQGRCTVAEVHERLDEACDLLLAWREPAVATSSTGSG
jgi:TetR/AcrR family transcriptional regulator, cholesterol catabolism regulator